MLPTFKVQKFASQVLIEHGIDYRTRVVHASDVHIELGIEIMADIAERDDTIRQYKW